MTLRQRHYLFVPFDQVRLAIFGITVKAAESALALFATSDALALGYALPAVWTNILGPEFKEIVPL
jgi:hypothetical protein